MQRACIGLGVFATHSQISESRFLCMNTVLVVQMFDPLIVPYCDDSIAIRDDCSMAHFHVGFQRCCDASGNDPGQFLFVRALNKRRVRTRRLKAALALLVHAAHFGPFSTYLLLCVIYPMSRF